MIDSDTKTGPSVEPVIISQLIYLYSFLFGRLMRHLLCHHQWFVALLYSKATVRGETSIEVEMLLKREF